MPTTPNGVSKYLAHHGFQRAERVNFRNRGAWLDGFRTELLDYDHDDVVLVWHFGPKPEVMIEHYARELQIGGYETLLDVGGRLLIVFKEGEGEEEDYESILPRTWARAS